MTRFALPAGRWRFLLPLALIVTGLSSRLVAMFEEFGTLRLLSLRIAASPSWVDTSIAVGILGIVAAAALRDRSDASAGVLAAATSLLLAAAAFTLWSALDLWSSGIVCGGPIR